MLETPVYIHSDGHVADMRHIAYGRAHGSRLLNLAGSGVSMHPCIIQWYFMPRTGYIADGSEMEEQCQDLSKLPVKLRDHGTVAF